MAFVRYKVVKGRKYYQYVRNYREGGRHKQEVLCHLGTYQYQSLEEAIDYEAGMAQDYLEHATQQEVEANDTQEYLLDFYGDVLGGEIPSEPAAWEMHWKGKLRPASGGEHGGVTRQQLEVERELLGSISDYHRAKLRATLLREFAEEHRAKRDKYTRIQQEYS
jgi:hypothetical protein